MGKIVIAGAGITGLSAGYHLGNLDFQIFEKEREPGGLVRSKKVDGFYLDYGGHFIHGKNPYFLETLQSFFGGNIKKWERRACILKDGKLLPYPFQANLSLLPQREKFECVRDFIKASFERKRKPSSLKEWLEINFGDGICKSFLFPYNSKFWIYPLDSLSYEWCEWGIPVPSWEETLRSALGEEIKGLGYNPVIYYPEEGIGKLPLKIMDGFKERVYTQKEIKSIDLKEKVLHFKDGSSIEYDILISTIPLPELVNILKEPPSSIKKAVSRFRFISVAVANAIVKGRNFENIDWIYIPEKWTPFYRIGFYPFKKEPLLPVFSEISHLPETRVPEDSIYLELFALLRKLNIVEKKEDIQFFELIEIPYAYVVFDRFRRKKLPEILSFLEGNKIISTGRYGGWDYLSMEKSFLLGKEVAEKVKKII